MATSWAEESSLEDMKHRLDKVRIEQSRVSTEEESTPKDTLKILQAKFGSMVYDPTSPQQSAYDRKYARSGRRKSIEFEDLYLSSGSRLLTAFGPPGSATSRQKHPHPLVRSSSGLDHSHNLATAATAGGSHHHHKGSPRKTSDPTSYFRKMDPHAGGQGHTHKGQRGQAHPRGHGQGHRGGLMHVRMTEEEKRVMDQKLAGLGGGASSAASTSPVQQRRRKISSPSKLGFKSSS